MADDDRLWRTTTDYTGRQWTKDHGSGERKNKAENGNETNNQNTIIMESISGDIRDNNEYSCTLDKNTLG